MPVGPDRKGEGTGPAPFAPVVLLLDDDPTVLDLLQRALRSDPVEVHRFSDGAKALETIRDRNVDLLITDLDMPGMSGLEVLGQVRRAGIDLDAIVVTGHATVDAAVACMRLNTVDFLKKPFDPQDVQVRVRKVLERRLLRREHGAILASRRAAGPMLIGSSKPMAELRDLLVRMAASDEIVLIQGESGTGKELVARSIHLWSRRAVEPFLAVDCTTLSPSVVESELFGHVKGAYTGADAPRTGLFQAAGRGTIFLDEVGDFPLELQPKLLRALQEREVRPMGSNSSVRFEARVLAATNRDLARRVREGKFREDLYWRLKVLDVRVPPLRERREDVPELARYFVSRYDPGGEGPREIDVTAAESLRNYDWPGNIRELENCVRRLLVLHPDAFRLRDLVAAPAATAEAAAGAPLGDWEKTAIRSALATTRGNVTQAARLLGISKSTLYRKMKEFQIQE